MNNHFKIIVPLYNAEKWVKLCLRSVKMQSYGDFQCIVLNDLSTDKSADIIREEIGQDPRFIFVDNTEKAFALKNIYDGIKLSKADPEDILVTLDGDDWLAGRHVLETLNNIYNSSDCWLTYGSYAEYPGNKRGKFAKQIPSFVIENKLFRQSEWCSSHLRTFKSHLWDKINKSDLLDQEGEFYRMAWDLAFMFPMLEMAGSKSRYVEDILYVYNVGNPLNDHKMDNSYQLQLEREIRSKASYNCLSADTSTAKLLNFKRFDIAAKSLYAKSVLKGPVTLYPEELYLQHLKVWNNLEERSPPKSGKKDFLDAFTALLKSLQENDFDENISQVPTLNNSPINGAHRVGACLALGKPLKTYAADPSEGEYFCNYKYFKDKENFVKGGLAQGYLDEMALEFCRQKDNLYTITLFPSHAYPHEQLADRVDRECGIIYQKKIKLTPRGQLNYIHNLYYNEEWIGLKQNGYPGVREKASYCFAGGADITVILIEQDDPASLVRLKEELRSLCKVDKHSVHINDTQAETWRIASSVFNENSVHFLNNGAMAQTPQFDKYFEQYGHLIMSRPDTEDFCVDSSAVLSAYGLRDCRDLDFLHLRNVAGRVGDVECHNNESHHYSVHKDDIICNPNHHFYFRGVKCASLDIVRKMKERRNEEKDRVDVALVKTIQ